MNKLSPTSRAATRYWAYPGVPLRSTPGLCDRRAPRANHWITTSVRVYRNATLFRGSGCAFFWGFCFGGSFPAGALEQVDTKLNRNGEVRRLVSGKHCEVNTNHAAGWSKQRCARPTFRSTGIVRNSSHFKIGDVALRSQRLNATLLCQVTKQRVERSISLLDSTRFCVVKQCEQPVWSMRVSHHHDRLPNGDGVFVDFKWQHRNIRWYVF